MKLIINTKYPDLLKRDIINRVNIKDKIKSWIIRKDKRNELLTHMSWQYFEKVLLKLSTYDDDEIIIVTPLYWTNEEEPSDAIIAIYLGMFTAMLLTHFRDDFYNIQIM